MMGRMSYLYAIFAVILISVVSLVGVLSLVIAKKNFEKTIFFLVSFSVGALFGDAFIHLLPESFEKLPVLSASLFIIAGIMIFFILEKYIRWHHCHLNEGECHEAHHLGTMNIIGDGVHNFIDGILVAASFLVSIPLGVATTTAIILHEIPSEIGEFGVLIHSGMKVKKALFYNFLSAAFAILGASLTLVIGANSARVTDYMIPIAAGGFIYIAGSDLIPELHTETKVSKTLLQLLGISLGIGIMVLLTMFE